MADNLTTMIAPDGTSAMVPPDQVQNALSRGARVAVHMIGPDGSHAAVPVESAVHALKAGARPADAADFARLTTSVPTPSALQQNMPADMTPEQYQAMTPEQQAEWDRQVRAARISNLPSDVANEVVGAGKGALSTLYHTGEIATKYLDPKKYAEIQARQKANPQLAEQNQGLITPDEGQKAGFYGEQAAEFLAPDAAIGDTAKGLSLLPRIATRAGLQGLGAAAVSAAHGDEHPLATGAVGAAGSAASEALDAASPWIREHAADLYNKALSPTTQANKNITQKIAPELIERGEWGSLPSLSQKAAEEKSVAGQGIDAVLQARGDVPQSAQSVIDKLEDFKNQFISSNGTALNPDAVSAAERLQKQVADMASDGSVSTKDLVAARRIWDDAAARAGAYTGTTIAEGSKVDAMRTGANSIRKLLADANPDLNALNKQYSFWSNVQRVADATIARRTGQVGGLLGNGVAETAGVLAGELAGAPVKGGLTGLALRTAQKTVTSPTVRTARAVAWGKLGTAIENGQFTTASKIARTLAAAGTSAAQSKENQ